MGNGGVYWTVEVGAYPGDAIFNYKKMIEQIANNFLLNEEIHCMMLDFATQILLIFS